MELSSPMAQVIGAGIQTAGAIYTNHKNIEFQREVNKQERQMFDDSLKYNSMSEQMRRNMEAGVHPMLAAGAQPTAAASAPSLEAPQMSNPFASASTVGQSLAATAIQEKQLALQGESLEIESAKQLVETLRVYSDLIGRDLTHEEASQLVRSLGGSRFANFGSTIERLTRDDRTVTYIKNAVESSDLDLSEKRYLYSWLDEFKNAEYTHLLADTELKQTTSELNREKWTTEQTQQELNIERSKTEETVRMVNASIAKMNEAKKEEIDQAIRNMQEEWKSLNFQGELDAQKLLKVAKIADSVVDSLVAEAKIDRKAARWYTFDKIFGTATALGNAASNGISAAAKLIPVL